MSDPILDAIETNLAQPRRARTEAGEVEQHELDRQIAAARFVLEQKATKTSPLRAIAFGRMESPGALG